MRNLTLDEKISIKGKLARKGLTLPRLDMEHALFLWRRCFGSSIQFYYKIGDTNAKTKNTFT